MAATSRPLLALPPLALGLLAPAALAPVLLLGLTATTSAQKTARSVVAGVVTNTPFVPALPPGGVSNPAGGCSGTFVDFELAGPCFFNQTVPLSNRYAGLGVIFVGPSDFDGGAVLDQCGGFGINARSGTNFLAFNHSANMSNGGVPTDPESVFLASPATSVSIYASGGVFNGVFQMDAYDTVGNLVDSTSLPTAPAVWTQLSVSAACISTVVLTETSGIKYFVYDDLCIDFCNPLGTNYCGPANLNSTGQSALISAFGCDCVSSNNVTLTADQMPANQSGYFLNSQTKGFVPFVGGSQGNLCLAGSIGRYNRPGEILRSGDGGTFSLVLDLTDTPQPTGSVSIMPGETWNFQAWFRDMNPGPTSNFTDGISITFY